MIQGKGGLSSHFQMLFDSIPYSSMVGKQNMNTVGWSHQPKPWESLKKMNHMHQCSHVMPVGSEGADWHGTWGDRLPESLLYTELKVENSIH